jgi:prophage regulatory protein
MNSEDSRCATSPLQILRLPQVCKVTGFCRSMIYLLEAEQRFPQRIKIGQRAVGWLETEVQAWLMTRVQGSRSKSACDPRIGTNERSSLPSNGR